MAYKKAIKKDNRKINHYNKTNKWEKREGLTQSQLNSKMYKISFFNRNAPSDEEWKDVVGYEGLYKVSNYGLVIRANNYKIVGTYYETKEYHSVYYNCVSLRKDGVSKTYPIHRLVALAFVENPNPTEFNTVNHKDENIYNNYYKNLEWCTTQYNLNYGKAKIKRQESKQKLKEWRKV